MPIAETFFNLGGEKGKASARFGSTYTKIGAIQRRLAWPLRKDDTQIREAFHIFSKYAFTAYLVYM